MKKQDLIDEVKKIYPYYTNLALFNKSSLNYILNRKCSNNIFLKNNQNSCYIDSLLISLFNDNINFTKKIFLESPLNDTKHELIKLAEEIRAELIVVYNLIQDINNTTKNNYCKNLRKMLNYYYRIKYPKRKINWTVEQLEPFDVITLLNDIFNIDLKNKINIKTYGCNDTKKKIILKKIKLVNDNIIIDNNYAPIIPVEKLLSGKDLLVKTMYPKSTEDTTFDVYNLWKPNSSEFSRKIEKITYLYSSFLFIHINRNLIEPNDNIIKIRTKVIPSLKIKTKENKFNLYLRSLIIHHGEYGQGHYTTVYVCKGKWYEYDDLKTNIKLIGNFEDVCKYNNSYYLRNCTNLIYY